jgi:hypothetical protein
MQEGDKTIDPAVDKPAREPSNGKSAKKRDLSDVVGTWEDDPAFDEAIASQDTIDEEMWR